ncbi:MAG: ABC transporter ATP-binding protein [Deltaproteobacteria bacterium]|nr:ABC transporter ATP-binding protein [Deltaproteobacteria bacterium]
MSSPPSAPSLAKSPLIEVSEVSHEYHNGAGAIPVLKGVSLTVGYNEMAAVMGPSGCGKSTLLSILGLLLVPSRGSYRALGRDLLTLNRSQQAEFRRKCIGFVFQSCNLIENTTVYENLEFPLIYAGVRRSERAPRIRETLSRVNLLHRLHHPSNLLSGGEQQRVAVARALVNRPQIILADEPTGQLDREHSQLVMDHFQQLVEEENIAVVLVTHDPQVAARCHRVYFLEDGLLTSERTLNPLPPHSSLRCNP